MLKFSGFLFLSVASAVREKDQTGGDLRMRELPCKLNLKHGDAVRVGETEAKASFSIELICSETVTDGRLMVPWLFKEGTFPLNIKGKDDTDEIEAGDSIVIWSSHMLKENEYFGVYGPMKHVKMLSYVNSTFEFTAKYGNQEATDGVSIKITEAPEKSDIPTETTPPMTGGDLPCKLMFDKPVGQNIAIKMECQEEVTEVRLITPPGYNNVKITQPVAPGKSYTLITLQMQKALAGKTFVLEGVPSSKSESSKSNVVTFPGAGEMQVEPETLTEDGFPCKVESVNTDLKGGGKGFSIQMTCEETVTSVILKIPGFEDRRFKEIVPGKTWNLVTSEKKETFVDKAFWVEATLPDGTKAKSKEVFQPPIV